MNSSKPSTTNTINTAAKK